MHLSKLFAILPLAAAVSGFIIPDGLPDGLYTASIDDTGNSTVQRVELPILSARTGRRGLKNDAPGAATFGPLTKRDSNGGTGRSFPNHGEYNQCTDAWWNYLNGNSGVDSRRVAWITYGTARISACNYKYEWNWVPPQTVHQFNGVADNSFGWWNTGWVYSDAYQWTFWRDLSSITSICTNGPY